MSIGANLKSGTFQVKTAVATIRQPLENGFLLIATSTHTDLPQSLVDQMDPLLRIVLLKIVSNQFVALGTQWAKVRS